MLIQFDVDWKRLYHWPIKHIICWTWTQKCCPQPLGYVSVFTPNNHMLPSYIGQWSFTIIFHIGIDWILDIHVPGLLSKFILKCISKYMYMLHFMLSKCIHIVKDRQINLHLLLLFFLYSLKVDMQTIIFFLLSMKVSFPCKLSQAIRSCRL